MTNTLPNALRLAVAVAISSSIVVTDARAGRSLQTQSVDISNNGYMVFTQSLVKVQPTLGDDQQPIPKSFTTTYPDQNPVREGYKVPSDDFTDVFSSVSTLVSIVDLFETGENDIAQKYTKVLKVGDEAVFKFTHSLEEKELVIEVRGGMTDQDTVDALRDQLACTSSLEPSTKLARPEQLYIVLEGVNDRAGNLGTSDHYVALASIKVEQVEVNGRTFMLLISGGDQPPELKRLGQSLFVNDEALLVAATSAYIQVHVLKEELQQEALNNLMAHSKPVGYVVHVEDNRELYPVPAGYPKLEAAQAREEIILFRGQKQNPADVAFVENLYKLLKEAGAKDPTHRVSTKVKKYAVKSYRHIIRSRQMTLLEELAAQQDAEFSKEKLMSLAYYESLQQALTSATPRSAYEFEFTSGHFKLTSSVVTSTWMHHQFVKYFGFKRTLKNLLTDQRFIQNMEKVIPVISDIDTVQADAIEDKKFASKVMEDMSTRLFVTYKNIDELQQKEGELADILNHLENIVEIDTVLKREKLRALKLKQKDDDTDVQQEHLLDKIKTMTAQQKNLHQKVEALNERQSLEKTYAQARKAALAEIPDIELSTPENRYPLKSKVNLKLYRHSKPKQKHKGFRIPKARPEVLETLTALEKALEMRDIDKNDGVYLRREDISENMQEFITEARERAEEQALEILEALEQVFNIKINGGDDKAARLARVRSRLDGKDISEFMLDKIYKIVWQEDSRLLRMKDIDLESFDTDITLYYPKKGGPEWLNTLRRRLTYKVEEVDERASEIQTKYLAAIENSLKIYLHENVAAEQRSMAFTARLARELQLEFENHANLPDRKIALRVKISELLDEMYDDFDGEADRRVWNNEIAHQLSIKDYRDDAAIDDQVRQIDTKLQQLDEEVFSAGEPDVNERIVAIEHQLDRKMARLGPEPRYVLDLKVARARQALQGAENKLEKAYQELDAIHFKHIVYAKTFAYLKCIPDEAVINIIEAAVGVKPESADTNERWVKALRNQQLQLGGNDGNGGKIQQLIQEHALLEAEIETREANIERMKDALKAAEKAVENDDGPFQYTPRQANVLEAIHKFTQQHPLKRQALQTAMGLAESAVTSGKTMPCLTTFNFDDEYAPIHLQALTGDKLTFKQTSRIVEVFKHLKTTFPESSFEPLEEVQTLVHRARHEMNKGAQQYNDEIYDIGSAGIHHAEHGPEDLKSFSEYFAGHSASGNKIIALLREGLISQDELENCMQAIRGADGYQTVDEFEHFLGYKHGVNVPHFKAAVQMLSDNGAEEFIQSAFTPVTATGPAGMKESVAGMKEYAAAVIGNYVLDDIAFDNGRRTAAFLTHVQDTLTPYANAAGISESELIQAIHSTLIQAHAAALEQQLNDYWVKPSASLVQAVTWYFSSYKPLLVAHNAWQASALSLSNMLFLYLLDLTYRGDYPHRMLTPFQHWLERYGVDLDRTLQYAEHNAIEQVSEVVGLAMPLGKAASSVILLRTGSMLFARQHNANPRMYRSISRLVPEMVKSMGSGQGVQVPLLNRVTPLKVKTLASATAGLVLGPVATVGAYVHGLVSGFTYAQTFGFALASSLTFDFFMNNNKMLTQWLGGPLGRSLDRINRWRGVGETQDEYVKRTAIASPQRYSETDEEYANRIQANNTLYGWTRHENYLQFRERRDRTMKLFENGWEKYLRENVPKWSFSHAESIPYSYTLGAFYEQQRGDDQKAQDHDKRNAPQSSFSR
ncbi:hypothetical protein [Endozoicomonas sp. 8E]|uniref:hypothetical protein n=1 Tax=Endozoicomonas sp. 8E TaxID=3035692 RepID=UPI0029390B59|nr:hypothetical protein [Endozoicomonas sp. 8E]WOG29581.1 hypothetical protein P6910_07995 [Endozoicomonas sp. 8E]